MWAGVAGGMAEYFEIDPSLVRILWVAAAILTWGAAVGFYIIAWILLPRDDAHMTGFGQASSPYTTPDPTPTASPSNPASETPWWQQSEQYGERHPNHSGHHHPRSTGIVLVVLGVILLAANAGFFSWVEWKLMWPLIFIGLGFVLIARQAGWRR
jgi:phage shock protein PspC (stress-responsive transcriptional regulator)